MGQILSAPFFLVRILFYLHRENMISVIMKSLLQDLAYRSFFRYNNYDVNQKKKGKTNV